MSNSCNNCDHKNVCVNCDFTDYNFKCPYWNGWYDAEDLPKEDGTYIIYGKGLGGESIGECYYTIEYGFAALNFDIIAWRELPKYE